MNTEQVVVRGRIRADGSLEVDEKVNLPPGPVSVTVEAALPARRKPTLQVLHEIWAERESLGLTGRSKQEIDAEINAMREEDAARIREIEELGRQTPTSQE